MPCADPMIPMLELFYPLFTAPTWKKMLIRLERNRLGTRAPNPHSRLVANRPSAGSPFSAFHQILNRARWSPLQASRQLLALIVDTFVQAGGTLDIVIDETLERRWGTNNSKRGHYRDSARSSLHRSVSSPGLRWIVLAVVVRRRGRGSGGLGLLGPPTKFTTLSSEESASSRPLI